VSISTRTRFEILKRDGFRCRYCGITAIGAALHVDHVLAVANGGTDDHVNLVTSCSGCNLGKSDVPLDESRLSPHDPLELAREHVEQMRAYLDAQKAVDEERGRVEDYWCSVWFSVTGNDPPAAIRWRSVLSQHPPERVREAIDAVADASWKLNNAKSEARYFYGCLRRRVEESK